MGGHVLIHPLPAPCDSGPMHTARPIPQMSLRRMAKFRRCLRRMLCALQWQVMVATWLGLLASNGETTRWLSRRVSELEHGMRCLLIIAIGATPKSSKFASSVAHKDTTCECAPLTPISRETGPVLGLSLAALGHMQTRQQKRAYSTASTNNPYKNIMSPADRLAYRLLAISHAMSDQDTAMTRMRQRICTLGLCVRALVTAIDLPTDFTPKSAMSACRRWSPDIPIRDSS